MGTLNVKQPLIALIPARSESKGLTNKNILKINNKPLIAYTVESAIKSKIFDYVIISSDSSEIIRIAEKYGAVSLGLRPKNLALDDSLAIDTYIYTIKKFTELTKIDVDDFIVLQPTSPLRNYKHIQDAWKLYNSSNCDSLISISKAKYPVEWALTFKDELVLEKKEKSTINNRQEMKDYYYPNGSIYILKLSFLMAHRTYYNNAVGFIMKQTESIDIDDIEDFKLAQLLLEQIK